MSNRWLRTAAVLWISTLLGCTIPLEVRRVYPDGAADPHTVEGLRYRLNRPVTTLSLRLREGADLARMGSIEAGECVPYDVELVIEQSLTRPEQAWVYETEYAPNPLANTDVTLTLSEDGTLAGVTAGETDQILPFIQAAVGLAIKAAAAGKAAKEGRAPASAECEVAGLEALIRKESDLRREKTELRARIAEWRTTLRGTRAEYERARVALEMLAAEHERIAALQAKNLHPLTAGEALVCLDGKRLDDPAVPCAATDTGSWLRVDLETES